jgi:uncharacterized coiled-coil protein SlyX
MNGEDVHAPVSRDPQDRAAFRAEAAAVPPQQARQIVRPSGVLGRRRRLLDPGRLLGDFRSTPCHFCVMLLREADGRAAKRSAYSRHLPVQSEKDLDMDERMIRLEEKVAFLEKTVAGLDETVEELNVQVLALRQELRGLRRGASPIDEESPEGIERPPDY